MIFEYSVQFFNFAGGKVPNIDMTRRMKKLTIEINLMIEKLYTLYDCNNYSMFKF